MIKLVNALHKMILMGRYSHWPAISIIEIVIVNVIYNFFFQNFQHFQDVDCLIWFDLISNVNPNLIIAYSNFDFSVGAQEMQLRFYIWKY
jgi:hypothetical protein